MSLHISIGQLAYQTALVNVLHRALGRVPSTCQHITIGLQIASVPRDVAIDKLTNVFGRVRWQGVQEALSRLPELLSLTFAVERTLMTEIWDIREEHNRVDWEVVRVLRDRVIDGLPRMHLAGKLRFPNDES